MARCGGCRSKYTRRQRKAREAAKAKRLCPICRKRKVPRGYSHCRRCRKMKAASARDIRRRRRAQALCPECGGEIEYARDGYATCGKCARRQAAKGHRGHHG